MSEPHTNRENYLHDLTMLYLKNHLRNLHQEPTPEEFAALYRDFYVKINEAANSIRENKQSGKSWL